MDASNSFYNCLTVINYVKTKYTRLRLRLPIDYTLEDKRIVTTIISKATGIPFKKIKEKLQYAHIQPLKNKLDNVYDQLTTEAAEIFKNDGSQQNHSDAQ